MSDPRAIRTIAQVWESQPTIEGAGVHLRRAFGFLEVPRLDPFLLLDDFHSENPEDYRRGFPWHPHRGIETITYMLDGEVEHCDSMGNRGIISAGDVQWMTAGSGIIHQEMPKGDRKGQMWGFQLWANLPSAQKMMDPRYQEVRRDVIPVALTESGASVRVICGEVQGVRGPVSDIVTDPEYLDVSIPSGKSFRHETKPSHTVFAYVIEGEGRFAPGRALSERDVVGENLVGREEQATFGAGTLVLYGPGNEVVVSSTNRPVRFLLVSGKPIVEPVAWHGPIVMNTQEELRVAFEELRADRFLKTR